MAMVPSLSRMESVSACEENARIMELWGVSCQGLLHLGNRAEGSGNGPSSFRVLGGSYKAYPNFWNEIVSLYHDLTQMKTHFHIRCADNQKANSSCIFASSKVGSGRTLCGFGTVLQ